MQCCSDGLNEDDAVEERMFQSEICDDLLGEVITEIRKLWPECMMVTGTPRHSESNGGAEKVNCTVQQKLHAWMRLNNSTCWSTGCSKVAWQVTNTQYHHTVRNVPYIVPGFCHCHGHTAHSHSLIDDPAIETPHSLNNEVMDKLEIFASDVAGEDDGEFSDDGGAEEDNANKIRAEQYLCNSHSGDNSEYCKHPYNQIWGQNTPLCMEIELQHVMRD